MPVCHAACARPWSHRFHGPRHEPACLVACRPQNLLQYEQVTGRLNVLIGKSDKNGPFQDFSPLHCMVRTQGGEHARPLAPSQPARLLTGA